ncbi:GHKL domain-containing protein [Bacillus sp. Bva_UNVM-123]
MGLNSIRTMIEKHHGHLDISYDENIFQMEIILFNIKRSA